MKKLITIWLGVFLAGAMTIVMPSVAGAAPAPTGNSVGPLSAESCGGDMCMYLSTPSGGTVYVKAWPYTFGFYGHFELVAPSGTYNSPAASYPAGLTGAYTFNNIPAVVGPYCVTGWSGSVNEGTVCNSVN